MSAMDAHVIGELSEYLDRTLPQADMKRVEAHLKNCITCQRHDTELRALRQMLRTGPAYTPPESFYQGVLQRIQSQPSRRWSWAWGMPAKALASACVVMLVVLATREGGKKPVPPTARREKPAPPAAPPQEAPRKIEAAPQLDAVKEESRAKDVVHQETASDAALKQMVQSAPANESLAKRSDVRLQARDMEGTAAQNSFQGSRKENTMALAAVSSKTEAALPEWKGDTSGIKEARTVMIETPDAWQALWREHTGPSASPPPAPDVDFTRNMVVGVFHGQIVEIRTTPNSVIVSYNEATNASTQPFHLKVIPKTNLLIQFKKL